VDKLAPLDKKGWRRPLAPPAGLVLLVTTAVWGSTFMVTKDLVASTPPLGYLALRFGIAAVVVLPVAFARRAHTTPAFLRDALVVGLFNGIGLLFQVIGQVYTTASKSAFITSLNTPLTAIIGFVVYRIVPSREQKAAVALATLGLFLLTWPSGGARVNPGDLVTIGCALSYGFYIVEASRRAPRHDAVLFAIGQIVVGALLFVLARAIALQLRTPIELRPFVWTTRVTLQMAYMSIVCVVLTMFAQTWTLQRLSATTAAVIYAAEPVFAMAIALAVDAAAEWPGARGATGALLVLFGLYVAEGRNLRRARSAANANKTSIAHSDD
jgi:drug/metabolite transporter (DMT)-like permease